MDRADLSRLAESGLGALPPDSLTDLSAWLRDFCWSTGNVAYCILSDAFAALDTWWEEALPTEVVERLDALLAVELPAVDGAPDSETARTLALYVRDEILQILRESRS